jgi:mRNA-degrading endonuclease RelE of RelBE toxin-antitoxin system
MAFAIKFSRAAREHLDGFRKRDQQILLATITRHLTDRPGEATRHRKQRAPNAVAPWELRVGDFRVFYDVHRDAGQIEIVAVGHKIHNVLYIGGEEVRP